MLIIEFLYYFVYRYDQGWVVEMVENLQDLKNSIIKAKKVANYKSDK